MAQSIFSLFGEVFVDTDKAESSLSKTEQKAGGVAETLGKGIKKAGEWGIALVAGTTAAVGGLVKFAESSAETADNIDKMSQKLGISRQSYQELDFILSQSGTSIDSFQGGMTKLLANMDKVAEGNKTAISNFDALGISVQNTDGTLKNQEEVLFETIQAFQQMEDSAEKTRLAQELFGKSGSELMPLLNGAAGSMEEMKQQAHDLGLVLSDETIDAGVELTDSLDQTKRAFESIITQLGGALMPLVTELSEYIQGAMPQIQEMISQLAPVLIEMFTNLLPPLMDVVEQLLPVLLDLIMQLLPPITEIINAILPVLIDLISAVLPIITTVLELLSPLLDAIMDVISPLLDIINTILPPLMDVIKSVISVAIEPLSKAFKGLSTVIGTALENAFDTVKSVFEDVKKIFEGIMDFIEGVFTGDWEKAWDGVKEIFSGIFDSFIDIAKAPLNGVIKLINKVFSAIGTIKIPSWVPIIGGSEFSLPQIPLLAKGGTITSEGSAIVGEAGAELIEMPQGARVTPLDSNGDFNEKLNTIVDMMTQFMPLIGKGQVVLDTGATVGALAPKMDAELGRRATMKGRYV